VYVWDVASGYIVANTSLNYYGFFFFLSFFHHYYIPIYIYICILFLCVFFLNRREFST
jgi:hypothetical protein